MDYNEERLAFPVLEDDRDEAPPLPDEPGLKVFKSAADILSIPDIETRDVWVPEWQTHVRVRGLSQLERDRIIDSCQVGKGRKARFDSRGFEAKFVIAAAQKPDGSPMFHASQLRELMTKNAGAVHRVYVVVEQMCGWDADATDGEDPLEALRGNSSATRNGASPSA